MDHKQVQFKVNTSVIVSLAASRDRNIESNDRSQSVINGWTKASSVANFRYCKKLTGAGRRGKGSILARIGSRIIDVLA